MMKLECGWLMSPAKATDLLIASTFSLLKCLMWQVSHDEARVRMAHEPYKLELVRDILAKDPDAKITLYHIGVPHF